MYEYDTPNGPARAYYQTQTTNGSQGYYENFMGDQGTMVISESEANNPGSVYRDPNAPAWDEWVRRGYISTPKLQEVAAQDEEAVLDVRESVSPDQHTIPVTLRDPYHQPHLQNFFDSVRGTATLNCPPEVGYETAVSVLKVNEAIDAKERLEFAPLGFLTEIKSRRQPCSRGLEIALDTGDLPGEEEIIPITKLECGP